MNANRRLVAFLTAFCMVSTQACSTAGQTLAEGSSDLSACPPEQVVAWGDSLTYSLTKVGGAWGQAKPTWPETVGDDLQQNALNFGVPSQGSAEIAVRQGGLRPAITLRGNEIPSGSTAAVQVTAISPSDGWTEYAKAGTMKMHGTLAGIPGTLQHTLNSGAESFTFVPDLGQESNVVVPAHSIFSGEDGAAYRGCTQIIWAGTNNGAQKSAILRDVASMVDWLYPPKKYLIIGTVRSIKDDLSMAYGSRFVDLRSWLVSDGLEAAGIQQTPGDAAAIAAGDIPPSLTVDGTHFTQPAYTAIGHYLASVLKEVR